MGKFVHTRILPVAEWMAENAYIAPGKHRLYTAAGLMAGLLTGRQIMNVLTGRNQDNEPIDVNRLAPPLRQFHGTLAYNKFDDTPEAKWHRVADALVPVLFGATGAMFGSSRFAQHAPATIRLTQELDKGGKTFQLQHADMLANKTQAKLLNFASGIGLNMGSTSGVHLLPSMLASSTSAFRFQLDHGKNIILPGLRTITGNRGHSSRNMFTTMDDFVSWAQNNAAHYGGQEWYKGNTQPILKYAKDMLQVFREATPQQRELVESRLEQLCRTLDRIAVQERNRTSKQGEALVEHLSASPKFKGELEKFISSGLEQSFIDAGLINPQQLDHSMKNIALGDYGVISKAIRMVSGHQDKARYEDTLKQAIKARRTPGEATTPDKISQLMPKDSPPYLTIAAATAGTLGIAYANHRGVNAKDTQAALPAAFAERHPEVSHLPRHEQARRFHAMQQATPKSGVVDWINGKPLDTLSWASNLLVIPPGLHRFMNAAFLSGFLYGGAQVSNALAARGLRGKAMKREEIWPMLRPLYGKMHYVWKSANPADRWKQCAHQLMPVGIGTVGTYTGSKLYFSDAEKRAKQAEFLEEYTDRIALEESEIFALASAATSIFNTGAGLHMLPFFGYPSHLQNRFLMAKGQQIATPGIGGWWSGNPSRYPWHVRRLLDRIIDYAVENTSEFPVELEEMSRALIAKLYPDLADSALQQKTGALVDKIYALRDPYWQPGGIPEAARPGVRLELEGLLRRAGLELTLQAIGLDPLKADIDNNGMSGKVTKALGAGGRVQQSIEEYRRKATARLDASPSPAANNDNHPIADNDNDLPATRIETPASVKAIAQQSHPGNARLH